MTFVNILNILNPYQKVKNGDVQDILFIKLLS